LGGLTLLSVGPRFLGIRSRRGGLPLGSSLAPEFAEGLGVRVLGCVGHGYRGRRVAYRRPRSHRDAPRQTMTWRAWGPIPIRAWLRPRPHAARYAAGAVGRVDPLGLGAPGAGR